MHPFINTLPEEKMSIVHSIYKHACRLMDSTPRFKLFTLHNKLHFDNLFDLAQIFERGGVKLSETEKFYLSISICTHDLGMCKSLSDSEKSEILDNNSVSNDYAVIENHIRDIHHILIDNWIESNFNFLNSLGLSASDINIISQISKCHRKINLKAQHGIIKRLGSLLRLIDELDITPNRAPSDVFLNLYEEMDPISRWHWFKHNIVPHWIEFHNYSFISQSEKKIIEFSIITNPPTEDSVNYWHKQIARPIFKALSDDKVNEILKEEFGVSVNLKHNYEYSSATRISDRWLYISRDVLSSGRDVVLVIDDEGRKYEDLFYGIAQQYHVEFAYNAKDALAKLDAISVVAVILDIQIPAGNIWNATETSDFKKTGVLLAKEIRFKFPNTKILVLTGTRHCLKDFDPDYFDLLLRKPIDPVLLYDKLSQILQ